MAKRRIHIDLLVGSEATADTLISRANSALAVTDKFFIDAAITKSFNEEFSQWFIHAQVRLNIDAEADQIKDFILDQWNNSDVKNLILPGSKVTLHTCTHDESIPIPCVEDVIELK